MTTMDSDTDPSVYCRTCRRALGVFTGPHGQILLHAAETRGEQVDHRPDPIRLVELAAPIIACDFCSGAAAVLYQVADQETHIDPVTRRVVGLGDYQQRHHAARTLRTETTPGITNVWGTRWTACEACAQHIDNEDLYGLITRVTESMPAKYTRGRRLPQVRGLLHQLYSGLFEAGPPRRQPLPATGELPTSGPDSTDTLPGGHDDIR